MLFDVKASFMLGCIFHESNDLGSGEGTDGRGLGNTLVSSEDEDRA